MDESRYRHRQIGGVILGMLGGSAALFALLFTVGAVRDPVEVPTLTLLATGLVMVALLFGWLTIDVSRERVLARFGIGLIWRRFRVADICSVAVVRNRWYYGWGIRLTPHGWLFNVSGLHAVEIELGSGRRVRIGTDEPQALATAIESVRGAGPRHVRS